MAREYKTADYERTLGLKTSMRDILAPEHLARFIVDMIAQLDLGGIYSQYGDQGAPPYAPEVLLGLLFYGYATGVFCSRKIEKATYEVIPFRFIAGDMHPDHDTIAHFRQQFLAELKELFVQMLLIAQEMGHLQLGNVSLDGSKIHADASKSKAVSDNHLLVIEAYLQTEVNELFALADADEEGLYWFSVNWNFTSVEQDTTPHKPRPFLGLLKQMLRESLRVGCVLSALRSNNVTYSSWY